MTTREDIEMTEEAVYDLLLSIGEDPERDGLKETPKRVAKLWKEFLNPKDFTCTTFKNKDYDQMIISKGLKFYSFCEHHMIPFFGTCSIGYIPDGKIVGISKLARTLDKFSRRLNTQEYMTEDIAQFLWKELKPRGLGVVCRGRHLCQEMRGIKKEGNMVTSSLMGFMKDDHKARDEFLEFTEE